MPVNGSTIEAEAAAAKERLRIRSEKWDHDQKIKRELLESHFVTSTGPDEFVHHCNDFFISREDIQNNTLKQFIDLVNRQIDKEVLRIETLRKRVNEFGRR